MRTIHTIYENILGITFELVDERERAIVVLEMGSISFMINHKELNSFIKSMEQIINYHKDCTCPRDLKNKMVIYQAEEAEIRMNLSYQELHLLKDLLKGTKFKLEMNEMLSAYRIE